MDCTRRRFLSAWAAGTLQSSVAPLATTSSQHCDGGTCEKQSLASTRTLGLNGSLSTSVQSALRHYSKYRKTLIASTTHNYSLWTRYTPTATMTIRRTLDAR